MPKRAVIYARYSSDNQRDESIDAQLRTCKAYAKGKGYVVVGQYIDRALTGRTDNRPDFRRMLADSARNLFDVVLIWRIDRFSRDRRDYYNCKYKLSRNDVTIESINERMGDAPEDALVEGVYVSFAQYFSDKLAVDVARGMEENALACRHTGGTPPLGYDVAHPELTYVVNESEAAVVRQIFGMYAGGASYDDITTYLNRMGYRNKRGGKFRDSSLHDLLSNEKYIGVYTYRRTPPQVKGQPRNNHAANPDALRIPGGMPAIIDSETWERVQKRMRDRKRNAANKAVITYLLSGKLFCGYCGAPMSGNRTSKNTGSYICSTKKNEHSCKKVNAPNGKIDPLVVSIVRQFLAEHLDDLARAMFEHQSDVNGKANSRLAALETQLAAITGKIDNIIAAIEAGVFTLSTKAALEDLEGQREALLGEIDYARQVDKSTTLPPGHYLATIREMLADPAADKIIIDTFVARVILWDDRLRIILRFSDHDPGDRMLDTIEATDTTDNKPPAPSATGGIDIVGGGERSRTPVRKQFASVFSERSR